MSALYRALLKGAAVAYGRSLPKPCIVSRHTIRSGSNGVMIPLSIPAERVTGLSVRYVVFPDRSDPSADVEFVGNTHVLVTLGRIYDVAVVVEVTLWLKGDV